MSPRDDEIVDVEFPFFRVHVKGSGGTRVRFGSDDELLLVSKMSEGALFLDGPHRRIAFPVGSRLRLLVSDSPLFLVVSDKMQQRRRQLLANQIPFEDSSLAL